MPLRQRRQRVLLLLLRLLAQRKMSMMTQMWQRPGEMNSQMTSGTRRTGRR
jgi:hypothetical protein